MSIDLSKFNLLDPEPEPILDSSASITNIRPDPGFSSVSEYLKYYNGPMDDLMQKRLQLNQKAKQKASEFKGLNRYASVYPVLETQPTSEYFNGNVVELGRFSFLVTQAPTHLQSFYRAVIVFKPGQVFQLTPYIEDGLLKAERYLPLSESEIPEFYEAALNASYGKLAAQLVCGNVFLTQQLINEQKVVTKKEQFEWHKQHIQVDDYDITIGKMERLGDERYSTKICIRESSEVELVPEQQEIEYIFFGQWADQARPNSIEKIFNLCSQVKSRRLVVHCSAGIGRSATFAVCVYIYDCFKTKDLKEGDEPWKRLRISIYEAVEQLRIARNPMCVLQDQFTFLFEFAGYCAERLK